MQNVDKEPFWFEKAEDGQALVTRSGKKIIWTEKNKAFDKTKQMQAGWQRAKAYMEHFGIWDATAFGCSMDTMLSAGKYSDDSGRNYLLVFATPMYAERKLYQNLGSDQRRVLRHHVNIFYNDPELQKKWRPLILRPVCFRIYRDGEIIPDWIDNYDPEEIVFNQKHAVTGTDSDNLEFIFDGVYKNGNESFDRDKDFFYWID